MDPREKTVKDAFDRALEIASPEERRAFLDEACGDDADLRSQVDALLRAHDQAGSFLEAPERPEVTVDEEGGSAGSNSSVEDLSPGTLIGTGIGPYKLLQQIGSGGMGTVYMAEQIEPVRRRVALKVINPGMDSRQVIARFEAERQALAMMDHQNIARVLDAGTTLGRPYFVMELIKGVPIVEYCDQNRLNVRERLELFTQVCHAVQHAHQKGIIHRDIKPSNILVTMYDDRAVPKVIDFGVAKAIEQRLTQKTMFTQFGQIVGTLEYMSPEQANLSTLDVDTRSDIYSLGVLLYELLTGVTPLDGHKLREAAFDEVLRTIREQEPPKPSTRLNDSGEALATISAHRNLPPKRLSLLVRGELDWIVMRSLEKNRARRYDSAAAFAADVQRYLAGDAVDAGPPSAAYKLRKFASKHRTVIGVAVSFAAVLLVAATVSTWLAIRATNSAALARESLVTAEQAKAAAERAREDEAVQRQAAEQASSTARAVSDFLRNDVLQQASPFSQPQGDLKLRAVLDQAAARIGDRFEGRPLVEADIRWTIGRSYWGLGRFTTAIDHLQRAVQLRREALGPDDPKTLRSMRELADFLITRGDYERGGPLLTQVLDRSSRLFGEEHTDTLQAARSLAKMLLQQGKHDAAEKKYRTVLDVQRRTLGETDVETLRTMNDLGWLFHMRGDHSQAQSLYDDVQRKGEPKLGKEHEVVLMAVDRLSVLHHAAGRYARAEELRLRVLAIKQSQQGERHPDTLMTMYGLVHLYWSWGKYDKVETLGPQVLAAYREVFGDGSMWTSNARVLLARLHEVKGRHEAAELLLSENVEAVRKSTGQQSRQTLFAMSLLAGIQRNRGRYHEAETLWKKVVEVRTRVLGADHPDTLTSRSLLGGLYVLKGEFAKAEQQLTDVLAARRHALGEDHPDAIRSLELLAKFRYQQQQAAEAEELWTQAVQLRKKRFNEDHPTTLSAQSGLASTYAALGKKSAAEVLTRQVLAARRRVLGERHPDVAESLAVLGRCLVDQKRYAEAEQQWRECLAIREEKTPDHWRRFDALVQLGASLTGQMKFEQAEPLSIEGYEGLADRQKSAGDKRRMTRALRQIVELYVAWKKPAKVKPWQDKPSAAEVDPACNSPP